MDLYDPSRVLELENQVLALIPTPKGSGYFKEEVAVFLYGAWVEDHSDMRLLEYSFPLIHALMQKNSRCLRPRILNSHGKLTEKTIFNDLCISLAKVFPNIKTDRGRIFSYFTFILGFRIKDIFGEAMKEAEEDNRYFQLFDFMEDEENDDDPLLEMVEEEIAAETTDEAIYALSDFSSFLVKVKESQGQTSNRITDALISVLANDDDEYRRLTSQSQDHILKEVVRLSTLPIEIVKPFYLTLLERYVNGVVD